MTVQCVCYECLVYMLLLYDVLMYVHNCIFTVILIPKKGKDKVSDALTGNDKLKGKF